MNIRKHDSPKTAAINAADQILNILREAQNNRGRATLAISGGSSPKPMFTHLAARSGFDWSNVHIFWVDERPVPPDHEQSNYRLAHEFLLRPAAIPEQNVHRIAAELPAEEAAARYRDTIVQFFDLAGGQLPVFDCIHLGVGPDAHTASLFPGELLIANRDQIAAAVHVRKLSQDRITLLPGVLLRARHLVVLATGEDKTAALKHIFEGENDRMSYPAQLVRDHPTAEWFIG